MYNSPQGEGTKVETVSDEQRAEPRRKPVLWLAVGTAVGMFAFLGWVCVRAFTA